MAPILLILAAGLGSRYCGLKQLDPVGPGGETLLDYAVHDAIGSGFGRLVFVIRRDFEAAFRSEIVSRYERRVPVDLVYQEVDDVPRAAPTLLARTKPWGTGHAVWAARAALSAPFAVINADDFYGRSAFRQLAHWLRSEAAPERAALVGYRLERTLSPHGPVSRGVCSVDTRGQLTTVVEHTGIFRGNDGIIRGQCERSHRALSGDEIVSMNCWGLHPGVLPDLERELIDFLARQAANPGAEFYLPAAISALVERGRLSVNVLSSHDAWFGVTYQADRAAAAAELRKRIAAGIYPERLVDVYQTAGE